MQRIDHVVYAVRDLDGAARRCLDEHGLASIDGGRHPRWGTANRVVPLGDTYLELLAVEDPSVAPDLARSLLDATADGDRWYSICVADDDVEATAARLGIEVRPGARTRPDGAEVRWRGAGFDDPARPLWLPFFIAWDMPDELLPGRAEAPPHPCGAAGIEGVEVGGDPDTLRAWLGGSDSADRRDGRRARRPCGSARHRTGRRRPRGLTERSLEVRDQVVGVLEPDGRAARARRAPRAASPPRSRGSSARAPRSATPPPPSDSARTKSSGAPRDLERLVGRADRERDHAAESRHLSRGDARGRDGTRARGSTRRGPSGDATRNAATAARAPAVGVASGPRASSARAARGSSPSGRAPPRPRSRGTRAARSSSSSLVTTAPPIRSECPPMYFVTLCTTTSAPSVERPLQGGGRERVVDHDAGAGRVRDLADRPDVDDLQQRVRRRLDPDEPGLGSERRGQARRASVRSTVVEREPPSLEAPSRAAGTCRRRRRRRAPRGRPGARVSSRVVSAPIPLAEREAALAALERGERLLERLARRVPAARVVPDLRLADRGLRVRRRLVDRDVHGAVRRVGFLARVDRPGLEPSSVMSPHLGRRLPAAPGQLLERLGPSRARVQSMRLALRVVPGRELPRTSSWQSGSPHAQ